MSLSSSDEVPHIFTRKSRLRPGKFLITGAKRVLQQNLPGTDIALAKPSNRGRRADSLHSKAFWEAT
jgi:hypothetical protein